MSRIAPVPSAIVLARTLGKMISHRSLLQGMEHLHQEMGDIFRIPLPGFNPVVVVGPEWARFLYVTGAEALLWRVEHDAVTRLLRHGLLVEDHQTHDDLRLQIDPSLHRSHLPGYASVALRRTDQVTESWGTGPIEILARMRRLALLILVDTLFGDDFSPHVDQLWPSLLSVLRYISPGAWVMSPSLPRIGHRRAVRKLDGYLFQLIAEKRSASIAGDDLVSQLVTAGLDDDLIRDQLMTMLIAGHDTSTSLLAWTLYLLASHPAIAAKVQREVDQILGDQPPSFEHARQLLYLGQVIEESLRLYPPIHLSNRIAGEDILVRGYRIPAGTRVMHSIYLTHRHPQYWPQPGRFDPERFSPAKIRSRTPYAYLPFGGGRRNCIGSAFGRMEAHIVLARLLQRFEFRSVQKTVRVHMGATLEPMPGVWIRPVRRRTPFMLRLA